MKKIIDYWKTWHSAILVLVFFVFAGMWVVALADDVKQQAKEIDKINLWRVNQLLWNLEDRHNCYSEEECLKKMSRSEAAESDKVLYRKLSEERKGLESK